MCALEQNMKPAIVINFAKIVARDLLWKGISNNSFSIFTSSL
jgi:hypothetical protein